MRYYGYAYHDKGNGGWRNHIFLYVDPLVRNMQSNLKIDRGIKVRNFYVDLPEEKE